MQASTCASYLASHSAVLWYYKQAYNGLLIATHSTKAHLLVSGLVSDGPVHSHYPKKLRSLRAALIFFRTFLSLVQPLCRPVDAVKYCNKVHVKYDYELLHECLILKSRFLTLHILTYMNSIFYLGQILPFISDHVCWYGNACILTTGHFVLLVTFVIRAATVPFFILDFRKAGCCLGYMTNVFKHINQTPFNWTERDWEMFFTSMEVIHILKIYYWCTNISTTRKHAIEQT